MSQIIRFCGRLSKNKLVSLGQTYIFWAGALRVKFSLLFKLNVALGQRRTSFTIMSKF